MAQLPITVWVKGDPKSGKLGDCPFSHRVLLALEAKNIPYEAKMIDMDDKPQWLIDVNGGKVPVIQEAGGPLIPDSDVIVEHLEKVKPEPSMKTSTPAEVGAKLLPSLRGTILGSPEEQPAKAKELQEAFASLNAYLEQHESSGKVIGLGQNL
jgi:glutathione S-transferase